MSLVMQTLPGTTGNTLAGKTQAHTALWVAAVVLLGLAVPWMVRNPFWLTLMGNMAVLAIAAVAIGFLAHQCGLMVFGIAAFTGGASYALAIGITQYGWGPMAATFAALAGCTVLSAIVGMMIVRARPLPFAMLTLALAQMLRSLSTVTTYRPITGGDDGLSFSFEGRFFGLTQAELARPEMFWLVAWVALCAVLLIVWMVARSRLGQVLRATSINEERMRFSGFNTYWPRVAAFTLTGFIAAVSGVLGALHAGLASPEMLDFMTGAHALIAALVGGVASVVGPVLGAILYVAGQDQFGASGHLELLTGAALIVVIVVFPQGAMGFVNSIARRLGGRGAEKGDKNASR